jgi:uncharacterized NAD(P)/FAD-binding protein YdhS
MSRIGIIGSGPTAIYTLHALLGSSVPLRITIYEKTGSAGTGMPYRQNTNHEALLANIASIELPQLLVSLVDWLRSLSETGLDSLGLQPEDVTERTFFPRVTLGTYFRDQFFQLVEKAHSLGHQVEVKTHHQVDDIRADGGHVTVTGIGDDVAFEADFDHVVVATGHTVDKEAGEGDRTYFDSPYPTWRLQGLPPGRIGILGTSLSGIDATISIALDHGAFVEESDTVSFVPGHGSEALRIAMMSRNGLLPEADFFCPFPYQPLEIFTQAAVDAAIEAGSDGLLDRVMSLFKAQLETSDPEWSRGIGLSRLDVDSFPPAYFAPRANSEPFSWARANLREVMANRTLSHTVPWRYAILRMHEIMEGAVVHFGVEDRKRFDRGMKRMFVDNYAAIPPQSVQRLLALHEAGVLTIERLGDDYEVDSSGQSHCVKTAAAALEFDVLINAVGEGAVKDEDIPFAGLRDHLAVVDEATQAGEDGGSSSLASGDIHMASLPYLLSDRPFIQGLVSSHELGAEIAADIIAKISRKQPASASMDDLLMSVRNPDSGQAAEARQSDPLSSQIRQFA